MISYSYDDGEILFKSDSSWDDAITEIGSIVRFQNSETEVQETMSGGLSISLPAFLENFDSIIEILSYVDPSNLGIEKSAESILEWARELLDAEDDYREALDDSNVQNILQSIGWDSSNRDLSEFQMRNLIHNLRRDNAAIFSVPGAGKTVEALAYSYCIAGPDAQLFVVCPRNAYVAWEEELDAAMGIKRSEIYRATGTIDELNSRLIESENPPRVVLVNYNRLWSKYRMFSKFIQEQAKSKKVVTVFDESHHFKGGKSFTSAVKRVSVFADHRVILSGTPMPRGADDLVHQFKALLPYMIGEINSENATSITQGRFVRTTKEDQGLKPPKYEFRKFEMDKIQREVYDLLTDFFVAEINSAGNKRALAELIRLQRILIYSIMAASNPMLVDSKFDSVLENLDPKISSKIKSLREGDLSFGPKIRYACEKARKLASEGKKVLIWSSFVENVELIAEELEDLGAVYIRGDVPTIDNENSEDNYNANYTRIISDSEEETREFRIDKFKNDDNCMVMVANPAAAGEGISLHHVCHHAIYIDRTFHATEFMQSMDRIHRYGKDSDGNIICKIHDTVIEILSCENSVDDLIQRNLSRKMVNMYEWLNDPTLNPQLGLLDPWISEEEMQNFLKDNR